ncbi:glucose-1-phosphate cytidylyltransferase [Reichenbachiella sp. MSK19-1]|uniref:glucose-1-phosphate cytidylyltransferase n=1 Tax=Reichenbachiella sp. MSK19-1 TaxID=1897631 RepID=UPI000E6BD67A|nr:glucose-1-phosphate cytidylyltransferase [Reichenbachiella sp. MSK19-1]RJE70869.1 glucose-1-phosphate cytidylyltransferase [Reichenbachiella sp. MSK19-1]
MKTVIFAGGLGSRISEESHLKPKPMIEIGGKPILWHIMKSYAHYGFNEFIICLGYKGYVIKEYFMNYFIHNADITVDLADNSTTIHKDHSEDFKITMIDTGHDTKTAGRLKKVAPYIQDEQFMLTYGDGVSNINIKELVEFHQEHNKIATVSTVQPAGKFGVIDMANDGSVNGFIEKPKSGGSWINGGFFVLNKEVFNYLDGDMNQVMWEEDPMKKLVADHELVGKQHHGFWKSMDILRDKVELEAMWKNEPKWKTWK